MPNLDPWLNQTEKDQQQQQIDLFKNMSTNKIKMGLKFVLFL
jgi:hypothetical protein